MLNQADVTEILKLVRDNADKLDLAWQIRPGTMVMADGAQAMVQIDGDTTPIYGTLIVPGQAVAGRRVWCVRVPPSNEYIIGYAQAPIDLMTRMTIASFSIAAPPTESTAISVTGVVTSAPLAMAKISGIADLRYTSAGASTAFCLLYVDGVAMSELILADGTGATMRGTYAQIWRTTLTPGSHTFELRAAKTVNAAAVTIAQTHTCIDIEIR